MATGAGLGGLLYALLPLIGIVAILRARAKRRAGQGEGANDSDLAQRQQAALETERRMAAYLAGRDLREDK